MNRDGREEGMEGGGKGGVTTKEKEIELQQNAKNVFLV